jgi:tetratricopeptide (TPR) repeat protein
MVTGDAPFSGPSAMELMLQRVQQRPKSARSKNPDVPEYFDCIIMRCLEKDPAARYQSAHEVLADLRGERSTIGPSPAQSRTITLPVPSRRGWIVAASLAALGLIAVAMPATRQLIFGADAAQPPPPPVVEPLRVAVLPFAAPPNLPELGYAAAGVEESLTSKLFQLKNVNLASPANVQSAMRGNRPPDQIGRELGASILISGRVQGSPERFAVTVSADEVAGSRRVWTKEFQGVSADLLTIQAQIFNELAASLKLSLSSAEQAATLRNPTERIDAYEAYLKGRRAMRNDQDLKNVEAAIGHYEDALKRDQRFALAYAGIADSSVRMYRAKRDKQWAERALSAAQQAQSIDDTLPEVHLSLGNVYQETGRTAEAIVELKRAAELAPSSDDAYRRLGRAYLTSGRADDAIAAYEKAVQINPYRWVNSGALGVAHVRLANYDAAIAAFKKVTDLAPDNVNGFNDLGAAYLQAGRPNEAIPAFEKALKLQPIPNTYSNLAIAYAQAGKFPEAVPNFEKAVELEPNDETFVGNLADGYRWAGGGQKAAATYDRAISLALKDLQVNPRNARAKSSLGLYYAKKGEAGQARRFMADARAIDKSNVDLIYNEAVLCAILNDVACSITNLEQALKEGYTIALIESDPDLRAVRSDPRYQALRARVSSSSSTR